MNDDIRNAVKSRCLSTDKQIKVKKMIIFMFIHMLMINNFRYLFRVYIVCWLISLTKQNICRNACSPNCHGNWSTLANGNGSNRMSFRHICLFISVWCSLLKCIGDTDVFYAMATSNLPELSYYWRVVEQHTGKTAVET